MHKVKEISESRRLYTSPEGVVSASENDLWLPALFDNEETATAAFDFPNWRLEKLQDQSNKRTTHDRNRVVTLLDLYLRDHIWFKAGSIVPAWIVGTRYTVSGRIYKRSHRVVFCKDVWVIPRGDKVLILFPYLDRPAIHINNREDRITATLGPRFQCGLHLLYGPAQAILQKLDSSFGYFPIRDRAEKSASHTDGGAIYG